MMFSSILTSSSASGATDNKLLLHPPPMAKRCRPWEESFEALSSSPKENTTVEWSVLAATALCSHAATAQVDEQRCSEPPSEEGDRLQPPISQRRRTDPDANASMLTMMHDRRDTSNTLPPSDDRQPWGVVHHEGKPSAVSLMREEFRALAWQASPSTAGDGDCATNANRIGSDSTIPLSDMTRLAAILGWPCADSSVGKRATTGDASLRNEEDDHPLVHCCCSHDGTRGARAQMASSSPHRFFTFLFMASGGRLQSLFAAGAVQFEPYEVAMRQWGSATLDDAVERVMNAVAHCYRAQCAAASHCATAHSAASPHGWRAAGGDEEAAASARRYSGCGHQQRQPHRHTLHREQPHLPNAALVNTSSDSRTAPRCTGASHTFQSLPRSPVRATSPVPVYADEAWSGAHGGAPLAPAGPPWLWHEMPLPLSQRFHTFCFDVVGAIERDFLPQSQLNVAPQRSLEDSGYSMGYRGISSRLGIRALQVTLGAASPMVAPLITFLTTPPAQPVGDGHHKRPLSLRQPQHNGDSAVVQPMRVAHFSRDLWSMLFVFCRTVQFPSMSGHRSTDCWPSVLDAFVEWWMDTYGS